MTGPDDNKDLFSIEKRELHALKANLNGFERDPRKRHLLTQKRSFSRFSIFDPLKTLTSLNKEVWPFFLSDTSILSYPSVSSLSDYSIWRF